MEFRNARSEDVNQIAELEKENFISPWTNDQFAYEIEQNEFSKTLLIMDNNILIGYLNYWIIFDQATINKICIKKEYRRQGLACKLISLALEDIIKNKCIIVTLEVRVSNPNAINLYQKNKFKIITKKPNYYSDGEDAFYMIRGGFIDE